MSQFGQADLDSIHAGLVLLREATNAVIGEHQADSDGTGEAINWADLHCVETCYIFDSFGDSRYCVVIEEASPECPVFHRAVRNGLAAAGFQNIDVRTEW